jgi:hypothetical protein
MNAVRQDESQTAQRQAAKSEKLPYCIELWADNNGQVEKVLARAATASLARAIFSAACDEHSERRLTLRQASRVLDDTGKRG